MAKKKQAREKTSRPKSRAKKKKGSGLFVFSFLMVLAVATYILIEQINHQIPGFQNLRSYMHKKSSGQHGGNKPDPVTHPAPKPSEIIGGENGPRLLTQTKSEFEKSSALLKQPPIFSDCSVSEHFSCLEITVTSDTDFIIAEKFIKGLWDDEGYEIQSAQAANSSNSESLTALQAGQPVAFVQLVVQAPSSNGTSSMPPKNGNNTTKARIAIVMDDLGGNYEDALALAYIPQPITFSILPFQKFSGDTLKLARSYGKPAMLHIPMQPEDASLNPGAGALLCTMSQDQIATGFTNALDSLPGVVGVNNHMGSLFTSREDLMKPVLSEIYSRGLFFLDSRTARTDIGFQLAQRMHVRSCQRDFFLDNLKDDDAIWRKLVELCRSAKNGGSGIAIGHPYPETIRVLKQKLGELDEMGCEVTPVQELCQ